MKNFLTHKQIALILSLFCCMVAALTLEQIGITWDEGPYIVSGERYVRWLGNPSMGSTDKSWSFNHEHPPLTKVLGGITEYFFHQKFSFLNRVTAYRLSSLIFVFFLIYGLFAFSAELYGRGIALVVTLSLFFLPRVFFHSHLGALDYPLTALWFLTVFVYWKGLKEGWRSILIAAVLLGFALLVKLTAVLIYLPLIVCWWIHFHGSFKKQSAQEKEFSFKIICPQVLKLVPALVIPPVMFLTLWPWLWKNSFERVWDYIFFHLNHFKIPIFYLGKQHLVAPWHYPIVFVMVTIPLIVLIPFLVGILRTGGIPGRRTNAFILFNALFPIVIASLPGIPKYDGIRLFLPAFPFVCMISGLGLKFLFEKTKRMRGRSLLVGAYWVLFVITLYFSIVKMHPYQSSYFNELAGGLDGASNKGFEHDYWGSSYGGILEWLNQNKQYAFWVCMTDIDPKIRFPFAFYKEMGLLNKDVRLTSRDRADYAVLLIRQGFFDNDMWQLYHHETPVFSVQRSGTPLVCIYKMGRTP